MVLRSFVVSCALMTLAAAAQPPSADDTQATFPPGRGRDAVLRICSGCHTPQSAVARFQTRDDWKKTLDQMGDNGAQASEEEWADILAYLDKNFSRIFVNTATPEELETTLDVTPDVADAIVRWRAQKGAFRSVDDLKAVTGLRSANVDARKDRFIF
jgi:competence protein ComEA